MNAYATKGLGPLGMIRHACHVTAFEPYLPGTRLHFCGLSIIDLVENHYVRDDVDN
jgi:hypothetical protein